MRRSIGLFCAALLFLSLGNSLAQQPSPPSVEALRKQLENSATAERVEAAKALGKLGQPATVAVDELIKLLSDPDPQVRGAGASALGALGPAAKKAAPELLKLFNDVESAEDQPLWHIAAEAYGKTGPEGVPPLLEHLSSDNRLNVYASATAIHFVGPQGKAAVPKLIELLRKNEPERRIAYIFALIGMGVEAEPAIPVLIEMLHSDDFHTQYWACRAIGKVGLPGANPALPELVKLLRNDVASVRGNAAAALGNLGPGIGPDAIAAIAKNVKDPLYSVRTSAVIALGKIGPKAIGTVPQIDATLANESFAARSQAALARWQITGEVEPTVKVLVQELENIHSPWDAAQGFDQMGKAAAVAVDRLIKLLDHKERETRVWTISSLAAIGAASKPAVPKLTEMLKDPEEEIREVAAEAIRLIENADK